MSQSQIILEPVGRNTAPAIAIAAEQQSEKDAILLVLAADHVILDVEKLAQKAEATLHVNGGELFATSEHNDMYAAIDALIDKLDRQVIKHKEKLSKH
jgi:ribosomal subunit interface protein